MVGIFPDPPASRIAYDTDGSAGALIASGGAITVLTNAQLRQINDEASGTGVVIRAIGVGNGQTVAVIFSQPHDLKGLYATGHMAGGIGSRTWLLETSVNSTTGVDGTWVSAGPSGEGATNPGYRTDIVAVNRADIRAIRVTEGGGSGDIVLDSFHAYGAFSAGATIQRLAFWHPTLDQPLSSTPAWLDWGNRPRNSTDTKTVRVKNLSDSLTANNILVGMEALTDASPTMVSQHQFKSGAGSYATTLAIPVLSPGQVSGVITIQQTLLLTAVLGAWAQRLYANAGSWT